MYSHCQNSECAVAEKSKKFLLKLKRDKEEEEMSLCTCRYLKVIWQNFTTHKLSWSWNCEIHYKRVNTCNTKQGWVYKHLKGLWTGQKLNFYLGGYFSHPTEAFTLQSMVIFRGSVWFSRGPFLHCRGEIAQSPFPWLWISSSDCHISSPNIWNSVTPAWQYPYI